MKTVFSLEYIRVKKQGGEPQLYRTIPVNARFDDEEKLFWEDQCRNANSLINCAIYHTKQSHYARLIEKGDAFTTYWRGDELRSGWKTYRCLTTYPELDKVLKRSEHYKAMAAQSAQQTLKSVGESITSYNGLVEAYYSGEVDRPRLPRYRKKGGLAAVTFPRQALNYKDGCFKPSISQETKPELMADIKLELPPFIDPDWVKEVTVRPCLGEFWLDWTIDDRKQPIKTNPNLDYSQAWGFDHGGANWLTGVSTRGKSLIINGKKLRAMNQGYCRLVAKYKQGKSENYWDENLSRVTRKRNNQITDAINKAARFIVNRCLADGIGNLVIGWNEQQKNASDMGKRNNQNFVLIPTGRLLQRLKQLCPEYGIVLTVTEEANTSKASFLDGDSLPKHGEKADATEPSSHGGSHAHQAPDGWKASGTRVKRGLYRSAKGLLINADCNGAANILNKVGIQLGIDLAEVRRGALALPQRYEILSSLSKSYRKQRCSGAFLTPGATSA